ncbi:Plasmodium exported protein, unknown function [Plasmodium reichenowi]|uniref:Uncharacterized protein n=1 Tax=Plasmodium reichenowi TaxID=5854 RepID=A0A2P9D7I7_PLARE|nr:Plasmodium exported protein, unknown function [Plasmodium reichenowi]
MVNKNDIVEKSNNIYFSNNEYIIDREKKNNLVNIKKTKCNTKQNNCTFLFVLISFACVILLFCNVYEAPFINNDHFLISYCMRTRSLYESEILHQESYHNDLLQYRNPHKNVQQTVSDTTFHKNNLLNSVGNHRNVNDTLSHVKNKVDNLNNTNEKLKNKKLESPEGIYSNPEKKIKEEKFQGHNNVSKGAHSSYDELSKTKKINKIQNNLKEKRNRSNDTFYFYNNVNMDEGSKDMTTSSRIDNDNNTNDYCNNNTNDYCNNNTNDHYNNNTNDYYNNNTNDYYNNNPNDYYNNNPNDHYNNNPNDHYNNYPNDYYNNNTNDYYNNNTNDYENIMLKKNKETYYDYYPLKRFSSEEELENYLKKNGLRKDHFEKYLQRQFINGEENNKKHNDNDDNYNDIDLSIPNLYTYNNRSEENFYNYMNDNGLTEEHFHEELLKRSVSENDLSNDFILEQSLSSRQREVSIDSILEHTLYKGKNTYKHLLSNTKTRRKYSNTSSIGAFSKSTTNISNASSLSSLNQEDDDEDRDFKRYLLKNNLTEEHFYQELLKYNGGKKKKKKKNKKKNFFGNDQDYNNLSTNFDFEQYKNFLNTDNNIYEETLLNCLVKFVFDDENYLKGKFLRAYLMKEVIIKNDSEEIQNALEFLDIDIIGAHFMTLTQFLHEYEDREEQIKTLIEIFVEELDEQDRVDICKNMIQYMKDNNMDIEAIYESLLDAEIKIPKRVKMILNIKAGMVFGAAIISLILFIPLNTVPGGFAVAALGYVLLAWYISSCVKARNKWTRKRYK